MPLAYILENKDFFYYLINLRTSDYRKQIGFLTVVRIKCIIEILINSKRILVGKKNKKAVNKAAKLLNNFKENRDLHVKFVNSCLIKYRLNVIELIRLMLRRIIEEIVICTISNID